MTTPKPPKELISFRLSPKAKHILAVVAKHRDTTMTELLERYILTLEGEALIIERLEMPS